MTRTELIPPNPNHFVGNHPLINSDQLDQYYPEPEDSRPAFRSAFNDASFHKGRIDWQPCPLSRKSLERAIQQINTAELPGGEHLIGYLQDQYRRNCKVATIRSAAEAIRCFLVFLKAHAIGKLEDIRRQHIGAFIEHEQDRGLMISSVRQKLQNVYAFMRYLSRDNHHWRVRFHGDKFSYGARCERTSTKSSRVWRELETLFIKGWGFVTRGACKQLVLLALFADSGLLALRQFHPLSKPRSNAEIFSPTCVYEHRLPFLRPPVRRYSDPIDNASCYGKRWFWRKPLDKWHRDMEQMFQK